jgi:hypothetical protein
MTLYYVSLLKYNLYMKKIHYQKVYRLTEGYRASNLRVSFKTGSSYSAHTLKTCSVMYSIDKDPNRTCKNPRQCVGRRLVLGNI